MGTNVCRSICLCVEKTKIQSVYWIFVENRQVSIGEHQSIRLSIEGNENRMCIKIMDDYRRMLLQEKGAATKV